MIQEANQWAATGRLDAATSAAQVPHTAVLFWFCRRAQPASRLLVSMLNYVHHTRQDEADFEMISAGCCACSDAQHAC